MDESGAEPKQVRWAKGKKKRATVHAHVEAHIPMVLAPTTPRLMAADLSNTKIWDEEQLQKLRQNWAWVNGVPEYPSTGKLEYLKLLGNLGIDSAKLDMVKKELSALKKPMTEMISKATDLLHQADLGFRAVEAMNGGPKMSTDDQAALGVMARLNAFQGESMLSSPAKTVAEKIKEHTHFPVVREELLCLVLKTTPYSCQEEQTLKEELKRQQKLMEVTTKALQSVADLKGKPLPGRPGPGGATAAAMQPPEKYLRALDSGNSAQISSKESHAQTFTRGQCLQVAEAEAKRRAAADSAKTASASSPTTEVEEKAAGSRSGRNNWKPGMSDLRRICDFTLRAPRASGRCEWARLKLQWALETWIYGNQVLQLAQRLQLYHQWPVGHTPASRETVGHQGDAKPLGVAQRDLLSGEGPPWSAGRGRHDGDNTNRMGADSRYGRAVFENCTSSSDSDTSEFEVPGSHQQGYTAGRRIVLESGEVVPYNARVTVSEVADAGGGGFQTQRGDAAVGRDSGADSEDEVGGRESSDSGEDEGARSARHLRGGRRLQRGRREGAKRGSQRRVGEKAKRQPKIFELMARKCSKSDRKRKQVISDSDSSTDDSSAEESTAGAGANRIDSREEEAQARSTESETGAARATERSTAARRGSAGDLQSMLHHTQVGRDTSTTTSQSEDFWSQQRNTTQQAQAGRGEAASGSYQAGRSISRVGLQRRVSPGASAEAIPVHDEDGYMGTTQQWQVRAAAPTKQNFGTGLLRQPRTDDQDDCGSTASAKRLRHSLLHQDRRSGGSGVIDQRGLDSGICDHTGIGGSRSDIQRGEVRVPTENPHHMVRHDFLFGGTSNLFAGRQGHKTSVDDDRYEGATAADSQYNDPAADTASYGHSDLIDGRSGRSAADGAGVAPITTMDCEGGTRRLGQGTAGGTAPTRHGRSSTGRDRPLDPRLRRGSARADRMERQVRLRGPARSSNFHGRVLEGGGSVGGGERPASQDRHDLPIRGRRDSGAHHISGNSSCSRWNDTCVEGEGLPDVHGGDEGGCHGGNKIHEMRGRQETRVCKESMAVDERSSRQESLCRLQQRLREVACGWKEKSSRQAQQTGSGILRMEASRESLQTTAAQVGSFRDRCVRGGVEHTVTEIPVQTAVGQASGGIRCITVPIPRRDQGSLGVPTSTQRCDDEISEAGRSRHCGSSGGVAIDKIDANKPGSANGSGCTSDYEMLSNFIGRTGGILDTCTHAGVRELDVGTPVVDEEDMAGLDWRTFVRRRYKARGVSGRMQEAVDLVFKPTENGSRGGHLDRAFARLLAHIRQEVNEQRASLPYGITDVAICNIAAVVVTGQSDAEQFMSGCRVIMEKAYGTIPPLQRDANLTKVVKAIGKKMKVKAPKYKQAVDLQSTLQVVAKAKVVALNLADTAGKKVRDLRNTALFLLRLHSLARTDDMYKFNALTREGMQVFHGLTKQEIVRPDSRYQELAECVRTQGWIQLRFYRPKGSEFAVQNWSTEVEVHTIRPKVVADVGIGKAGVSADMALHLCAVRAMRDYMHVLEARGMVGKINATKQGGFWSKTVPELFGGTLEPLAKSTLRNLVMKFATQGGLQVNHQEEGGKPEREKLSAHFLRGHAGSLAYTLSVLDGATWSSDLHLNRARHTAKAFHKNYSRGVQQRVRTAFQQHKRKLELRFEEALIL